MHSVNEGTKNKDSIAIVSPSGFVTASSGNSVFRFRTNRVSFYLNKVKAFAVSTTAWLDLLCQVDLVLRLEINGIPR